MALNNLPLTISISKKLLKKLDKVAELEYESRSYVIRNALRDYLDKRLLELGEKE